ncbi:MAG TPA: LysR family transcriptional regulator [Terriglobales bacterium]|nr:LysR family transcriptional regulator [Terriglobales bacterium]
MNLNHLRLFAAAASAGSISAAAARLRLSQPALSKQIRELEGTLGAALLEREARGVVPTEAGSVLAEYARQIFDLEAEAERALAELRDLARGRLRLGASMTIGVYLLPEYLAASRRRWPGLEIEVEIENTDRIQQGLIEHRLDLGLTEGPGRWDAELDERVFQQDELIVIAASRGPDRAALTELAREPWVMREPGSGTRMVVEETLAAHGLAVRPAWIFNDPEAIKRAVMAGCGVALVPRIAVESELASHRLKRVAVRGLRARRALRLQWRKERKPSAAMAAFSGLVSARAKGRGRRAGS